VTDCSPSETNPQSSRSAGLSEPESGVGVAREHLPDRALERANCQLVAVDPVGEVTARRVAIGREVGERVVEAPAEPRVGRPVG